MQSNTSMVGYIIQEHIPFHHCTVWEDWASNKYLPATESEHHHHLDASTHWQTSKALNAL